MNAQLRIDGFSVRRLAERDKPVLQAAFDLDQEYFEVINGRQIPVEEICMTIPASCGPDDKLLFAIEREGKIAGMIDIIRHYPEQNVWYLGFLYIVEAFRGGMGRRVLRGLYPWVKANGGVALRLGVVEPNARARHLYATEGFVFEAVREPDLSINRVRRTLVLQRAL